MRFGKSWIVNLRILFDLPYATHCWIVEDLSNGKHLKTDDLFEVYQIPEGNSQEQASIRCLYNVIKNVVN